MTQYVKNKAHYIGPGPVYASKYINMYFNQTRHPNSFMDTKDKGCWINGTEGLLEHDIAMCIIDDVDPALLAKIESKICYRGTLRDYPFVIFCNY